MKARLPAIAVLTISLAALAAHAQGVYRCGNDYGQTRCAGGTLVQVDDARTVEQKQQTVVAATRDAKTADAMEKARLHREAKVAPAVIVPNRITPATTASKPEKKSKAKKSSAKNKGGAMQPSDSFTATDGQHKTKTDPKKRKSKAG